MRIDPIAQDIVAVVLAVAGLLLIVQGRRIRFTLGRIDAQVNNVPKDAPTLRENVDAIAADLKVMHERLAGFLPTETITTELAVIHERLDEMTAAAARHHPDG